MESAECERMQDGPSAQPPWGRENAAEDGRSGRDDECAGGYSAGDLRFTMSAAWERCVRSWLMLARIGEVISNYRNMWRLGGIATGALECSTLLLAAVCAGQGGPGSNSNDGSS